jgi:hypothetical protein
VVIDACGDIGDHGPTLESAAASDKGGRKIDGFGPAGPENRRKRPRG